MSGTIKQIVDSTANLVSHLSLSGDTNWALGRAILKNLQNLSDALSEIEKDPEIKVNIDYVATDEGGE